MIYINDLLTTEAERELLALRDAIARAEQAEADLHAVRGQFRALQDAEQTLDRKLTVAEAERERLERELAAHLGIWCERHAHEPLPTTCPGCDRDRLREEMVAQREQRERKQAGAQAFVASITPK